MATERRRKAPSQCLVRFAKNAKDAADQEKNRQKCSITMHTPRNNGDGDHCQRDQDVRYLAQNKATYGERPHADPVSMAVNHHTIVEVGAADNKALPINVPRSRCTHKQSVLFLGEIDQLNFQRSSQP
jgi:hypothetical protein